MKRETWDVISDSPFTFHVSRFTHHRVCAVITPTRRIADLQTQLRELADEPGADKVAQDLAAARQQLARLQSQHEARN